MRLSHKTIVKNGSIAGFLLVCVFCLVSCRSESQNMGSAIRFDETTGNIGRLEVGETGEYQFEFVNAGAEPLTISSVSAECQLSYEIEPGDTIPPGEKGQLTLEYIATDKVYGPVEEIVNVRSNDAASPLVKLRVKADIKFPLEFSPNPILLGNINRKMAYKRHVQLINNSGESFQVIEVKAISEDGVSIVDSKLPIILAPDDPVGVKINIAIPKEAEHRFRSSITFKTDHDSLEYKLLLVGRIPQGW